MTEFDRTQHPHRRYNPLTEEWILVSPHRAKRPWQGKQEEVKKVDLQSYNTSCLLCPGNKRVNGNENPQYPTTYVFTNDHPAILPDTPKGKGENSPFFKTESIQGTSRVMCFSPKHNVTLSQMDKDGIKHVITEWINQYNDLKHTYSWIQIFENKGEVMGCSNPHPHCQVWASNFLPTQIKKENVSQLKYYKEHSSPLLLDYLNVELTKNERIICENKDWAVLVPYWALWPYETLLLPKRHILRLTGIYDSERDSLAQIIKTLLLKYDALFKVSFPYSMGWHGAPFGKESYYQWQLHAHYYPPLLRSATVKKFMVGYEMLSEAQRDLTPEQAAEKLKSL